MNHFTENMLLCVESGFIEGISYEKEPELYLENECDDSPQHA
jgi:hypothetical protein